MNEIEQLFYNTYLAICEEESEEASAVITYGIHPQQAIGIYKVDFVCGDCAIEIDGHEYHKTKEQREKDYQRERYLLKRGVIPVRFTATEVYLHPRECVLEAGQIASLMETALYNQKFGVE